MLAISLQEIATKTSYTVTYDIKGKQKKESNDDLSEGKDIAIYCILPTELFQG